MHNAGGELRRMPLPRTPVNKGKKAGRSCWTPGALAYPMYNF